MPPLLIFSFRAESTFARAGKCFAADEEHGGNVVLAIWVFLLVNTFVRIASHKDVLERRMGGRPAHTAVFDELRGGRLFTLWVGGEARSRDVAVRGGTVTELDWRSVELAA